MAQIYLQNIRCKFMDRLISFLCFLFVDGFVVRLILNFQKAMPVSIEFPTEVLLNTAITPDSEWTTNGIIIVETVKRKIPYLFVPSFLSSECINHQIRLTNVQDDDVELLKIEENNESWLYSKAR